MNFGFPQLLWLLLLLVPLVALLVWSWRVRQRLLTQFISARLIQSLTIGVSKERQKVRIFLFVLAVASLIFSLSRPQLGFSLEESKQSGLDIVVAIDTSKSMLADDVQPNRLQRAKLAALDLMRLATSDRLGLVAFAGGAFLQCPLSLDEEAFRQSVEFLDVNVIPQGGTALAEAIQTARAAFKEDTENHKILVLFTDGEDNDDQDAALEAAREAHKAGLRIFTIGAGTPSGEVLSSTDPFGNRVFIKDSQGNVVKSRLNEPLLQQIAKETDGFYLPLSGARTMDVLYERGLAPLPKSEFSTRTLRQYHERFQWFIGAAILLLLFEMLFPERSMSPKSKVPPSPGVSGASPNPKPVAVVAALALLICVPQSFGSANAALNDYQKGKYTKARGEFERLARKSPDDARLRYNAGAAAFGDEDYETALKHFSASLSARDLKLQEQSYYNLGNAQYRLGEKSSDAKEKQQNWEQSIHQYESALKLDPADPDAKFNLDLVKQKLEELKQQQQQQKQQDKKDDQNKDEQKDQDKQQQDKNQDQQKKDGQQKKDEQKQDKSDQQKQDEQKQKEQDSQKKDQQSQQQEQQKSEEQKKQDQQTAQDQRGKEPDKSAQQQGGTARVMQMTPQEAQQLLDVQKSEERAMIFQPQNLRTNRPKDRVFKDW